MNNFLWIKKQRRREEKKSQFRFSLKADESDDVIFDACACIDENVTWLPGKYVCASSLKYNYAASTFSYPQYIIHLYACCAVVHPLSILYVSPFLSSLI